MRVDAVLDGINAFAAQHLDGERRSQAGDSLSLFLRAGCQKCGDAVRGPGADDTVGVQTVLLPNRVSNAARDRTRWHDRRRQKRKELLAPQENASEGEVVAKRCAT